MNHGDPEFSRAFVAAYQRMPQWRRDQFEAHMREAIPLIERICKWVEEWEAAGVQAAEEHANGEKP